MLELRRFSALVFLVTFWSKMSYAYRWKGDQMLYLLVKVSFAYLLPVSLKLLCFSVLSTKGQFVQCYSVLSDFQPMAHDDYVTWLGEFSVILFYLLKVTSLEKLLKMQLPPLHKFRFPKLKRFVGVMTNFWLYRLLLGPNNPLSQTYYANWFMDRIISCKNKLPPLHIFKLLQLK